ncbi:hypothetical protein PQR64_37280 [Paraburkholderia phytofirmans]|uniref:hypothetical protein n=1 Tax=Paraburkholderia phytofirmans TaxID=261302 RepID=UPI0038BAEC12
MVLYESRQDALNHMREALRDIAPIAARDIERNFELYELSLQSVVDGLKDPAVMALSPRLRREELFDRAASAKYLGAMLVLDARGDIVLGSGSDVARQGNFADASISRSNATTRQQAHRRSQKRFAAPYAIAASNTPAASTDA